MSFSQNLNVSPRLLILEKYSLILTSPFVVFCNYFVILDNFAWDWDENGLSTASEALEMS